MKKIVACMLGLFLFSSLASAQQREAIVSWEFATSYTDGSPLTMAEITATKIEWGTCAMSGSTVTGFGTLHDAIDVPKPTGTTTITSFPAAPPDQPFPVCFRAYTVVGPVLSQPTGAVYKVFYPAPTVDLNVNKTVITQGEQIVLSWTSTGTAGQCTASGAWSGAKQLSGTETLIPLAGANNYTLTCTGQDGQTTASDGVSVTVNVPAPTLLLAANPVEGIVGTQTTLTWETTNATSCTASGGWNGPKNATGSEAVAIANVGTNTYTLACTGDGGTVTQSAVVAGLNPLPTVTFGAVPTTVDYGASSTLTWTSTNATTCTATGAWSGTRDANGSFVVTNLTTTGSYGLTCTGPGGSADAAPVTITVKAPLPPTLTISAAPTVVNPNNTTTITWSAQNATSCVASGAWSGPKPVSGIEPSGSLSVNSTFTLTCSGPAGDVTQSVSVEVRKPEPPVIRLSANPAVVYYGNSTLLSWSSENASSCEASDAWTGSKRVSGTEAQTPLVDSNYKLTCQGSGGSAFVEAFVDVQNLYVTSNTLVPTATTRTVWVMASERNKKTGVVTYKFWMPIGTIPIGKACLSDKSYGENLSTNNPNRGTGEYWYGVKNSDVSISSNSLLGRAIKKGGILAAPCDWS